MLCFVIFCHIWFLHTVLICCIQNSTAVVRFSVPEDHHVLLRCGGSDSPDVVWTHQDRRVPVTRQGGHNTDEDPQRHLLLSDGSLHLLQLDDSDSGEYHCNQQLVAELQVLTGHDFTVSAGRTLLLPCSRSSRPRRRWYLRRDGGKREAIFTLFRNGTTKPERGGGRLSYENDALQIEDLRLEDAGRYQCNADLWTRVTVRTEVETKKKEKKKRPENALLIVAVVGLGFMILIMAAVCVLLTSMHCKKKTYTGAAAPHKHDDTEQQPWETSGTQTGCEVYESPSPPEETVHYASLGRQNWRDRPRRTPPDQNHRVIYSSVITRPPVSVL